MLFRLILLLVIAGALTVFTVQNLTPVLPLVFLGIQFPALPLSWWVLGTMGAGVVSMLTIQGLIGLSNFVTGQTVRSRVRARANRSEASRGFTASADPAVGNASSRPPQRERSTSRDDSAWQDWRGYESTSTAATPRSPSTPVDDWERPPGDDWDSPPPRDSPRRSAPERGSATASPPVERESPSNPRSDSARSDSSSSSSYRESQDPGVGKSEKVVDADYRVIVPPYRPLDEPLPPVYTPPPPPPPVAEDNADDWFEETSDDFGEPPPKPV